MSFLPWRRCAWGLRHPAAHHQAGQRPQIVTRPVNASAYEHASRAFLYEEEERWKTPPRSCSGPWFSTMNRLSYRPTWPRSSCGWGARPTRPAAIRASFKIEVTADGLMPRRICAKHRVTWQERAILAASGGKVDLADQPDTAETVSLELAEAQILALDVPSRGRHSGRSLSPGTRVASRTHAPHGRGLALET